MNYECEQSRSANLKLMNLAVSYSMITNTCINAHMHGFIDIIVAIENEARHSVVMLLHNLLETIDFVQAFCPSKTKCLAAVITKKN